MADFTKVFGDSKNLISLDGTLSRSRINPDIFSFNSKPIVLRTNADLVRQSSSNTLVVPSTKGIKKPIARIPNSTFKNRPIQRITDPTPLVKKISTKSVAVIDRETKQISEIPPINFKKRGEIVLTGANSANQITFDKYQLDDIIAISSISFQFILRIIRFDGEFYYTSSDFKSKLEEENSKELPYRIIQALNPSSIITVDVRSILNSIAIEYSVAEKNDGAFVEFNTFVDTTGEVDNVKLVEYIDWVVSKPAQEYDNRTIPAETLGRWSIIDGEDNDIGVSIPIMRGTATPTKLQSSDTLSTSINDVIDFPKPIRKLPQQPEIIVSVKDKPIINPKRIGSGLADIPIKIPKPNIYNSTLQNPIKQNFVSIVRGAGLVPELPISLPTLRNLSGGSFDSIGLSRVRNTRNIL